MPLTFFLTNDAFYFGVLPVLAETAAAMPGRDHDALDQRRGHAPMGDVVEDDEAEGADDRTIDLGHVEPVIGIGRRESVEQRPGPGGGGRGRGAGADHLP